MTNNISDIINKMAEEDQRVRNIRPLDTEAIKKVDQKNQKTVKKIVKKYGLITISEFDKETSDNAWLLVQHFSKGQVDFMKQYMRMMRENESDITRKHIPYLEDRINMYTGKPQVYGTQTTWDEKLKSLVFHNILDIKNVDTRRKEYGLKTLREYIKILRENSEFPLTPPKDY